MQKLKILNHNRKKKIENFDKNLDGFKIQTY